MTDHNRYYQKSDAIVGYTYQAENVCPACLIEMVVQSGEASPAARDMAAEDVLDQVAGANGIDRDDESSFDSDEFPKVVLACMVDSDERCGCCDEVLG